MRYYYKRTSDTVSRMKLYSYTFLIIGIVSIVFYGLGDSPKAQSTAKLLMFISFGICAIISFIDVFKEMKTRQSCNIYDIARCVVSAVLCIMSATCIDAILN